jgi:hypothetical protein
VADNVTIFSLEIVPTGWFAPETQDDGWFDRDLLDTAAASGDIAGSTTLTFTLSGAIGGSTALAGATTLTFSTVGAIVGIADIAGASSLTFSTAGTIEGTTALSGATTLTFTPSGAIEGLSGTSDISGSTTLTFTCQGAIEGLGEAIQPPRGHGGDVRRNYRVYISPDELDRIRDEWRAEAEARKSRPDKPEEQPQSVETVGARAVDDGLTALRARRSALVAATSLLELQAAQREADFLERRMEALRRENALLLEAANEIELKAIRDWVAQRLRLRMNQQAAIALILAAA